MFHQLTNYLSFLVYQNIEWIPKMRRHILYLAISIVILRMIINTKNTAGIGAC